MVRVIARRRMISVARILIVDDHDDLRAFMRGIFEPAYVVFEARGAGAEVVKRERPVSSSRM